MYLAATLAALARYPFADLEGQLLPERQPSGPASGAGERSLMIITVPGQPLALLPSNKLVAFSRPGAATGQEDDLRGQATLSRNLWLPLNGSCG